MMSEMICDRIVVGIKDSQLPERLQLDPDLTLEKAKKGMPARGSVATAAIGDLDRLNAHKTRKRGTK